MSNRTAAAERAKAARTRDKVKLGTASKRDIAWLGNYEAKNPSRRIRAKAKRYAAPNPPPPPGPELEPELATDPDNEAAAGGADQVADQEEDRDGVDLNAGAASSSSGAASSSRPEEEKKKEAPRPPELETFEEAIAAAEGACELLRRGSVYCAENGGFGWSDQAIDAVFRPAIHRLAQKAAAATLTGVSQEDRDAYKVGAMGGITAAQAGWFWWRNRKEEQKKGPSATAKIGAMHAQESTRAAADAATAAANAQREAAAQQQAAAIAQAQAAEAATRAASAQQSQASEPELEHTNGVQHHSEDLPLPDDYDDGKPLA